MTIVGGSLWYSTRLSRALVATDNQRLVAEQARHESEQSRLETLAQEEIANQYLYASRMKLAFQRLGAGRRATGREPARRVRHGLAFCAPPRI